MLEIAGMQASAGGGIAARSPGLLKTLRGWRVGKATAQNILLSVASFMLSLVLAEVETALLFPSNFVKTDILGRRIMNRDHPHVVRIGDYEDWAPGQKGHEALLHSYDFSYEINSLSLRGAEIPEPRADVFRILVLGDSQTFGEGIDQGSSFCDILQKLLDGSGGTRYQVLNGGVNGYGTFEELGKLKRLAPILRPRLVVVVVDVDNVLVEDEGNDLMNNYRSLYRAGAASLDRADFADRALAPPPPTFAFLANHSHLYGLLSILKRKLTRQPTFVEQVREYGRLHRDSPQHRAIWEQTRAGLVEMARLAETFQPAGRLVILHLPGLASLELGDDSALDELQKTGLPVISAFGPLQRLRAGDTMRLRFRDDAHYNVAAHEVIGRALYDGLVIRSILLGRPGR